MILDQVFYGVLNESVGTLEVYDEPQEDVSAIRYPLQPSPSVTGARNLDFRLRALGRREVTRTRAHRNI